MESEKVKEIKKALEQNSGYIPFINKHYNWDKVSYADILTYINELESKNDTIKFNMQETEKASFNTNQMNGNLVIENQQLKDRIAELEKDNAYKQEHIELWFKKNEEKKKRIAELEKQNAYKIDETLNKFINKGDN